MGFGDEGWMKRAACNEAPDWVDFAPLLDIGEDPGPARAYCAACPVSGECLLWALVQDESLGVWGGMTELERQPPRPELDSELHPCCACGRPGSRTPMTPCDACTFTQQVSIAS